MLSSPTYSYQLLYFQFASFSERRNTEYVFEDFNAYVTTWFGCGCHYLPTSAEVGYRSRALKLGPENWWPNMYGLGPISFSSYFLVHQGFVSATINRQLAVTNQTGSFVPPFQYLSRPKARSFACGIWFYIGN